MKQIFISSALLSYSFGVSHHSFMKKNAVPAEQTALSLQDQRNNAIRVEYHRMFNVQGKRNEVILKHLSGKYFLAPDTIERIVFQRGRYRPATIVVSESSVLAVA